MKTVADAIVGAYKAAAEKNKPTEIDYIDADDGLYHCGVCHRPKQKRQEFLGNVMVVPIMCKCREDEVNKADRQRQTDKIGFLKQDGFQDRAMEESRFEVDRYPDSKESQICRKFVEHFDEFYSSGKGLVLTGPVGTGKTFYATCIANALMERLHPVLVTSISRFIRDLTGSFEGQNEHIDYLRRFDLVVFDDLGVERNTEYVNELVFSIIDGRIRSGKPMIITTNVTLDELKKTDGIVTVNARLYDRILAACVPVPFEGENKRRGQAREEYRHFKDLLGI